MLFNNVIYLPNKTTMQIFICKSELSQWTMSEKSEINQAYPTKTNFLLFGKASESFKSQFNSQVLRELMRKSNGKQ